MYLYLYQISNKLLLYIKKEAKSDWDFWIFDLVKTLMELLFNPLVNFGEVRMAQLAKSTLLTSTMRPLGSFKMF